MAATYLILGNMPTNALKERHLPAGTWCFLECASDFPDWEKQFSVPDSLDVSIAERRVEFFRAARWGVESMWDLIGECKQKADWPDLSDRTWEYLFGPWAVYAACFIDEAHAQLRMLKKRYGAEKLIVPVLAREPRPQWLDLLDLLQYIGTVAGYHWLLSRLLELEPPPSWSLEYIPHPGFAPRLLPEPKRKRSKWSKRALKNALKNRLLVPQRLFPDMWRRSIVSFALYCNKKTDNNAIHLKTLYKGFTPAKFSSYAEVFRLLFPEGLHAAAKAIQTTKPLHSTYVSDFGEEGWQNVVRKAAIIESGGRVINIQHAPTYYDNFNNLSPTITLEIAQHSYLCWGKCFHTSRKVENLPNFNYINKYNSYAKNKISPDKLIYVHNNEQPLLDCSGLPGLGDTLWMRRAARQFFSVLHPFLYKNSSFKPYPFVENYNYNAALWIIREFPELSIHASQGNFFDTMREARLLVSGYFRGCVVAQSMCQNIPTICFYRDDELLFSPEAEKYILMLRDVGILRKDATDAAEFANEIWGDVDKWWNSPAVQKVRLGYLKMDIGYGIKYPLLRWIKTMVTV